MAEKSQGQFAPLSSSLYEFNSTLASIAPFEIETLLSVLTPLGTLMLRLRRLLIICAASALATLSGCAQISMEQVRLQQSALLFDAVRNREIPVQIYFPTRDGECVEHRRCPVAILSGGYGSNHKAYSFIAHALNDRGYLVVSIQHELSSDAPLAFDGDLYTLRMPVWHRGVENLRFARTTLAAKYPQFNWQHLVLIGHSNGGDISALLATEQPAMVSTLITLDHRRMPLPRTFSTRVLSIRASDFDADPGVLPNSQEQSKFGMGIVKLKGAKHNDMQDGGSPELKRSILASMESFLAIRGNSAIGTSK